ncbi:MAG: NAD-dependent epimerase/dehydratase family protein [Halioglobus sp.]
MKCLVTGATGFIGREVCEQLGRLDYELIPLSRYGGQLVNGTSSVAVDLSTTPVDSAILSGVDVVFHLAGIAHTQAAELAYSAVNHQATITLAAAAEAAGVRRFVFLSSVKAMGAAEDAQARCETGCVEPLDPYGRSKILAENALRDSYRDSAMSVVILRPPLVYGPEARGNLGMLSRAVSRGLPRPPSGGFRSMIGRADLAAVLIECGTISLAGVHTWIVTDGESYSLQRSFDALAAAGGRAPVRAWLPAWCWRLAARAYDVARGFNGNASATDSTLHKLFGEECYDSSAILAATDWRPRQTLEEVMSRVSSPSVESAELSQ